MGSRHNVKGYDYPGDDGMVWRQDEHDVWFRRPCEITGYLYAPFHRPLSPVAHRVLLILRDWTLYDPPYGDRSWITRGWVPITFLHYEANRFAGGALRALDEIRARGIHIDWTAGTYGRGASLRLR